MTMTMKEIKRANAKLAIMERDPEMFGTSLLWHVRAFVALMGMRYWRRRAWKAERRDKSLSVASNGAQGPGVDSHGE